MNNYAVYLNEKLTKNLDMIGHLSRECFEINSVLKAMSECKLFGRIMEYLFDNDVSFEESYAGKDDICFIISNFDHIEPKPSIRVLYHNGKAQMLVKIHDDPVEHDLYDFIDFKYVIKYGKLPVDCECYERQNEDE